MPNSNYPAGQENIDDIDEEPKDEYNRDYDLELKDESIGDD